MYTGVLCSPVCTFIDVLIFIWSIMATHSVFNTIKNLKKCKNSWMIWKQETGLLRVVTWFKKLLWTGSTSDLPRKDTQLREHIHIGWLSLPSASLINYINVSPTTVTHWIWPQEKTIVCSYISPAKHFTSISFRVVAVVLKTVATISQKRNE